MTCWGTHLHWGVLNDWPLFFLYWPSYEYIIHGLNSVVIHLKQLAERHQQQLVYFSTFSIKVKFDLQGGVFKWEGGFFPVNKQLYTLSMQSGTALSVNSYLKLSQKVDVRSVGHKE